MQIIKSGARTEAFEFSMRIEQLLSIFLETYIPTNLGLTLILLVNRFRSLQYCSKCRNKIDLYIIYIFIYVLDYLY